MITKLREVPIFVALIIFMLILAVFATCAETVDTQAPTPTASPTATRTPAPTIPTPTSTPRPTATPEPTATPMLPRGGGGPKR